MQNDTNNSYNINNSNNNNSNLNKNSYYYSDKNINNNEFIFDSLKLNGNKNFDSNIVYGHINEKNRDPFNFVDDMLRKK